MNDHAGKTNGNDPGRMTVVAGLRSGKPTIRGMRITVEDVLGYLAAGMSRDEVLDDFPELTPEDIDACLAYDRIRRDDGPNR